VSSRLRPVLAIAICASFVAGGAALAAPKAKPVCNLIADDKGDGAGFVDNSSGGLDVVTADIASDAKTVTAVLRLAAAPPAAGDPNAPEGATYYVSWNAPGATNPVYLSAATDATGAMSYAMGDIEPSPTGGALYQNATGAVTGHVDGSVITINVDRGVFGSLASMKPGTKMTSLQAEVFYPVEVPMVGGLLEQADAASGTKPYIAGAASCVVPGK
jgi:hypothetical protein